MHGRMRKEGGGSEKVWEEEEENGVQVRADSIVRVVSSIPESK